MTVKSVRLDEFIRLRKGKPPAELPYWGDDGEPYLNPEFLRGKAQADLAKPALNSVRVKNGDTVLLWDGSNAGEFFWGRDGLLASTMTHIGHDEEFESEYFYYAVKRWEAYLKGQTSGSGIPHVDKEVLGKREILQFPHGEQSQIATFLSGLDQAIEQTEALIAKQQRIKTGLMQDLLTKGIDKQGNIRSEATHEFKDSPLGRIPVEWSCGIFGELWAESPQNGLYKPQTAYSEEGTSIVRIDGFCNGDLIEHQTFRRLALTLTELRSFALKPGDLVINRVNSIEWLGKAALVGKLRETMVFESNMMRLRIDSERAIPEFSILVLSSPHAYRHYLRCAKTAIAQASINQEDVRSLPIACPPPTEQVEIVRRVDAIQELIERISIATHKLRRLKTGLMHDLLTGECRVTPLLATQAAHG